MFRSLSLCLTVFAISVTMQTIPFGRPFVSVTRMGKLGTELIAGPLLITISREG
jgi:hypothetical protein